MRKKQGAGLLLAALALLGTAGLVRSRQPDPAPTSTPAVLSDEKAQLDLSRLSEGVIGLRYTGGEEVRVKARITKEGGQPYHYDLDPAGEESILPLTQGDGTYTVQVLENIAEDRYNPVYTETVTLALADPNAPFLQPSQMVNYTPDSAAAVLAAQVMGEGATDANQAALAFDYVVDHLTYDEEKAATVASGYLPDVDAVLASGEGICYDYAALLAAMLRSQGIPCKLVVGYAGTAYHAWVEVYCEAAGTVDGVLSLTAGEWTLLDPTFVSNSGRSQEIWDFVTDRGNYTENYVY